MDKSARFSLPIEMNNEKQEKKRNENKKLNELRIKKIQKDIYKAKIVLR